MSRITEHLRTAPVLWVVTLAVVQNVAFVAVALAIGRWLTRRTGVRRGDAVAAGEARVVALTVVLNSAVAVVGLTLWRGGWIVLAPGGGWRALGDCVLFLIVMDVGMYVGHRFVLLERVFPVAHALHHRYDVPRPLSLFVLHPLEVVGFGGLWITVMVLHRTTAAGVVAYAALNLLFGTLAHLGVDPIPAAMRGGRLFRWVTTPTFHAQHHEEPRRNYGFYTVTWDRVFGTMAADYDTRRAAPDAGTDLVRDELVRSGHLRSGPSRAEGCAVRS